MTFDSEPDLKRELSDEDLKRLRDEFNNQRYKEHTSELHNYYKHIYLCQRCGKKLGSDKVLTNLFCPQCEQK